ncbi:MAG: glycine betaine ABC transporter substrate-binding protein [Bacteroidales bacterium]|nr:glycine betaine ABC transporter substrate-binding protein [Bacteroidales bacterium]MDD3890967.1 glycine betaine ABC transporter substrate-binding protein [Bacteroidales bacterium]
MKTRNILLTGIMAVALLFSSCGGGQKKQNDKEVTIAMVNWVECIANAHLCKVVLEEKGYSVDLINADVGPVFTAIAKGDADVFMEVWEPITHKAYLEKFGNQLEKVGVVYEEGVLALVVPEYVTINSIDELNSVKDKFKGVITGIDPGAGIMGITAKLIDEYGLDYELVPSSEAGMLASLKRAYDRKEWVVVTGWKPHSKFARHNLKLLEDPKGTMGQTETISIFAQKGWSERRPELAAFFGNVKMNDELWGSLMLAIESKPGKEDESARKWYHDHKEIIDTWFEN